MTAGLPVPLRLVHRNETTTAERTAYRAVRPARGARRASRPQPTVVLGPTRLAGLGGSVQRFEEAVRRGLPAEGVEGLGSDRATVDRLGARPSEVPR